ncbi:MAG: DUF6179 domain-containing protein [Velocimicrobium sp.]
MNINPELLIPIVAKLSESYTSKESTSISYDIARQLMGAVLYCLNETAIYPESSADELIERGFQTDVFAAYEQGYQLVCNKVCKTKELYNDLILYFNDFGNLFLADTIKKGMPAFFLYYDAKFNPQNHILTLDYSTIKSVDSLCGVDAIYQYLNYIQLEQDFLSAFPIEYVHSILSSYHEDCNELPINICEVVFSHLLACFLIGKELSTLYFTKDDIKLASNYLTSILRPQIEAHLTNSTKTLVKKHYLGNQALLEYLLSSIPSFTVTSRNAAKNNCLHTIFCSKE